jgi:transposase
VTVTHRRGNIHLTTDARAGSRVGVQEEGQLPQGEILATQGPAAEPKRAALAIGHRILVAAYHMLSRSVDYRDLGAAYLDRAVAIAGKKSMVARLKRLGFRVHLEPVAPAV